MSEETPTNPNNLPAEAAKIDPLGMKMEVSHLLPSATGTLFPKGTTEAGAKPLENKKQEAFAVALTGWGGDGKRITNCKAYEIAYGKGGSTARSESTRLLARPEVKARVEYLEKRVAEAKRHDYLAAQQDIDEFRLQVVERAKKNPKLVPIALIAARDFEKAHGLEQTAGAAISEETEIAESREVLPGILATIRKVVKRTRKE